MSFAAPAFGLEPMSHAERLVPPAQRERGRATTSISSAPEPIRAPACRACCPPLAFSTRSCRMPQFSPDPSLASLSDHAACRACIRLGSRSFYAASRLLPAVVRRRPSDSTRSAGCRTTRSTSAAARPMRSSACATVLRARARDGPFLTRQIGRWPISWIASPFREPSRRRCSKGSPGMPKAEPMRRSTTLLDYAARVAGTVGVMMALLMDVRSPEALARACDLGVAMQLTNIARDVGEDARLGRLYLPRRGCARPASTRTDGSYPAPTTEAFGRSSRGCSTRPGALFEARAGIAMLPPAAVRLFSPPP